MAADPAHRRPDGWAGLSVACQTEPKSATVSSGTVHPDMVTMRRYLDSGGSEREVGIVVGAVTVVDEDRRAARRRAGEAVAIYLPVVAGLDPTTHIPRSELREMSGLVQAGRRRAAGELVPDDLLERFAFFGTPDDVATQAIALFEAGAARVEFGSPFGLELQYGSTSSLVECRPSFAESARTLLLAT